AICGWPRDRLRPPPSIRGGRVPLPTSHFRAARLRCAAPRLEPGPLRQPRNGIPAGRRTAPACNSTPRRRRRRSSARSFGDRRRSALLGGEFQLGETARLRFLDVAETRVAIEVVVEGALPRRIIRQTPHPAILGRAGIGE